MDADRGCPGAASVGGGSCRPGALPPPASSSHPAASAMDVNVDVHAHAHATRVRAREEDGLTVVFGESEAPGDVKPVEPSSAPTEQPSPWTAFAAGGAGLAGWAGLTYFGLTFQGKVDDLEKCDPDCPQSQIDEAKTPRNLAMASLGLGVVGTGLASYLFFTRPERSVPNATVSVMPDNHGVWVTWHQAF